jgi:hypothetical protein
MKQVGVQINGEWKDCPNIEGWSNDIKNTLEREELSFLLEFLIWCWMDFGKSFCILFYRVNMILLCNLVCNIDMYSSIMGMLEV